MRAEEYLTILTDQIRCKMGARSCEGGDPLPY